MVHATISFDTALGPFVMTAECDCEPSEVSFSLSTVRPKLSLPPGMSVLACQAAILRVVAHAELSALRWTCTSPVDTAGSPCPGQYLEAQEWERDGRLVVVGTEDEEALSQRLPFVRDDPFQSIAEFAPQSIQVKLPLVPKGAHFGLHFIIAENPSPEPVDASAWFAVEIPHARLVPSDAA